MKIMFNVAPPSAPSTGTALAAARSDTTRPKRATMSVTRLFTTVDDAALAADEADVATPRSISRVETFWVSLFSSARVA